jgi:peptidoglycan-associated lipoprotein
MTTMSNEFPHTEEIQKTGRKMRWTKRLVAAGLAAACVGTASPVLSDFGSEMTLKLGSSGLYNHRLFARQAIVGLRQGGAHISADFTMPGRSYALSPFLDVYHRVQNDATAIRPANDAATNMIAGVNFLFTGFRSERATYYLGIGGGAARFKVVNAVNIPIQTSSYRTRMMADALMGVELKLTPGFSVFAEPHYMWTTKMLNGLAVHAGLAIHFNRFLKSTIPVSRPTYIAPAPAYRAPAPLAPIPMEVVPAPMKVEEVKTSSASALRTMEETIHFRHDRSNLSDSAKVILDRKLPIFIANPDMRIVISGFTSQPGTENYNMALGLRRAESARVYLISKGVAPIRIEIATEGEGQFKSETRASAAGNRRDQFRLLIADPFLQ